MNEKPGDLLAAIAPSSDVHQDDTLSGEAWQRLCAAGDRHRQGDLGMWKVVAATSDFVKVSGDTAKAIQFMATLTRVR